MYRGIMRGKFITFEGCDGVGKSTQIKMFKTYLENEGVDVLLVREPGGNVISEKIREIILDKDNSDMSPECELLLYYASRAQLIEKVIEPSLAKGVTVICDRFIDSSIAYQGYARGIGVERVVEITRFVCKNTMPDATVFLNLPPEQAFRARGAQDDDRIESEGLNFQQRVYRGFLQVAEMFQDRIVSVVPCRDKNITNKSIIEALEKHGVLSELVRNK